MMMMMIPLTSTLGVVYMYHTIHHHNRQANKPINPPTHPNRSQSINTILLSPLKTIHHDSRFTMARCPKCTQLHKSKHTHTNPVTHSIPPLPAIHPASKRTKASSQTIESISRSSFPSLPLPTARKSRCSCSSEVARSFVRSSPRSHTHE